jgi:hypothetical protein
VYRLQSVPIDSANGEKELTRADRTNVKRIDAHNARYVHFLRKEPIMNLNTLRAIVCTILILASLFLVSCTTVSAQENLPIKVFTVSAVADWSTTYHFLNNKTGIEGNPMLRFTRNQPLPTVLLGTAYDVSGVYLWYRFTQKHRRIRTIGLYAASGFRIYLAAHNLAIPRPKPRN